MKKIICIGESNYNIVLDCHGKTLGAMPGGIIANAAAILASSCGLEVLMASEAAADVIGDLAVAYLGDAGVDISAVDRYTEGRTAVNFHVVGAADTPVRSVRYEDYPDEAFDIIWPRVEEGDIVVFGGYYALDPRMRRRMMQFIDNAAGRKAILVYLPGFNAARQPRITRVMPAILENLELADMVVSRNDDLGFIFGSGQAQECYRDHIDFYCRSLVNIDVSCGTVSYCTGRDMTSAQTGGVSFRSMLCQAGALAGIISALHGSGCAREALEQPGEGLRRSVVDNAVRLACAGAKGITSPWQAI